MTSYTNNSKLVKLNSNIKILGLSEDLKRKLDLSQLTTLEYDVEIGFGAASEQAHPDILQINKFQAIQITKSRSYLSKVLKENKINSFHARSLEEFYEDETFNVTHFRDDIGYPCILHDGMESTKINQGSQLLMTLGSKEEFSSRMIAESCITFDSMFIVHASPWLNGTQVYYPDPIPRTNSNGIIYASKLAREKFFSAVRSKDYAEPKNSNLTSIEISEVTKISLRTIQAVGLDFAEVNIAYSKETNVYTVFDVKSHIRFDKVKNQSRIANSYSTCLKTICEQKYKHTFGGQPLAR